MSMETPMTDASAGTIVRWMWRNYLRRFIPLLILATVLMIIEGSMLGLLSLTIEPMFDNVFISKDKSAIPLVAGAIFAIFVTRALTGFAQRLTMANIARRVSAALQRDLIDHILTLDTRWFQTNPPGTLIERVRGDTGAASRIWNTVMAAGGRDIVALISLLAVAMSIDWVWTVIALAGVPLVVAPIAILQRWIRSTARIVRGTAAQVVTRLDEIFHGVNTIKLNRLESYESNRFGTLIDKLIKHQLRTIAGRAAIPALMDIIAGVGFFGVIYYGGLQIIDDKKTVGEFMSFFTAMALVFDPLRRLGGISGAWQVALVSLERLYATFEEQPGILDPATPKALPMPAEKADIVISDVHMAYQEAPVLNGLSFTAKAGEVTALVGASGAGKSTVFNLLTRLVEPHTGRISIGGLPIDQMRLFDLRNLYSVVSQDTLLFDDTLRDNIVLGRTDTTEAQLSRALNAAHITDFLPVLEDGLDSAAGPRGSNLSGGQRQRIAIARALLRDTPILLLDEATSALDAKSEVVVQQALERLSEDRTTIVIAHRLATVRDADKIVVMDKGRAVEEGTHAELLDAKGVYFGLYQLQFATEN